MPRTLDGILVSLETSLSRLKPPRISSIYISGGNPGLIPTHALGIFLESLYSMLGLVEEFSIEVNPGSFYAMRFFGGGIGKPCG